MTNWIHVDQALPREGQRVIYYFDVVGLHTGYFDGCNTFYNRCGGSLTGGVTHWMPCSDDPDEYNTAHNDGGYIDNCLDNAIESIAELHMAVRANDIDVADGFAGAFFQAGNFHINTVDVEFLDNVGQYEVGLEEMLGFLREQLQQCDVFNRD